MRPGRCNKRQPQCTGRPNYQLQRALVDRSAPVGRGVLLPTAVHRLAAECFSLPQRALVDHSAPVGRSVLLTTAVHRAVAVRRSHAACFCWSTAVQRAFVSRSAPVGLSAPVGRSVF
jgi:hypothetical protein